MRGRKRDLGNVLGFGRLHPARRDDRTGAVGIEQIAALRLDAPNALADLRLVYACSEEGLAVGHHHIAKANRPALLQAAHFAGDKARIAAARLKQEALEIGGNLDIHGGRGGRNYLAELINSRTPSTLQNVVLVGGKYQSLRAQTHGLGAVAGEDIAEVAGGSRNCQATVP